MGESMKRRFKAIDRSKVNKTIYIIFAVVTFISTLYVVTGKKENREFLLSALINETTNKENVFISSVKTNLIEPKYVLYSSLNKIVPKNNLTVFNAISEDDFDYENAKSDYAPDIEKEEVIKEPIVYIYNTHQLEEYEASNPLHSVKPNVMIASYIFREKLRDKEITSMVETNNVKEYLNSHDLSYNDSYEATQYFAKEAKKNYPSIRYMFDLHRDSATKNITSVTLNDKPYTKVLFVAGYEHTIDEKNIGFAETLEEITEKKYPGLSRGLMYRIEKGQYGVYDNNIDATSILLEIGGVDSTLEEVNNTLEALADVFSEYLGDNL